MIFGLFLILSFMVVSLIGGNSSNLGTNYTKNNSTIQSELEKVSNPTFNTSVKTINWDIQDNNQATNYDWTSSGWVFGPKPSYTLLYNNNTPVTRMSTVWLGESVKFQFSVPMSAITTGNPAGMVGMNLYYYEYIIDSNQNYQPIYDFNGFIGYDNISKVWKNSGNYYDYQTNTNGQISILTAVTQSSNYDSVNKIFTVNMAGTFNSLLKSGRYYMNLQITDNQYNYVDTYSYNDYDSEFAPNRDLWINAPYTADTYVGYGDGFTAHLLSNDMQPIDGVKRGVPTLMQVNVTTLSDNLDTIIWSLPLPTSYIQTVNRTEYYTVEKTYPQGWVWNAALQTYIWQNADVKIEEEVYGSHEVKQNMWIDRSIYVNNEYHQEMLYMIYDTQNGFSAKLGYDYYDYNNNNHIYVYLADINAGSSFEDKLIYPTGASFSNDNGDWTGYFNFTVNPALDPDNYYGWFSFDINKTDGQQIYPFDNSAYGNLNVDKKTAKVSIFDNFGKEVKDSFKIKDGQSFMLTATVQGDTNSLDAASMVLEGWDYTYSDTSSQYSDVLLRVRYDWKLNQVTVFGYNSTSRNVLQTGTYWDWVEVDKTGWHWEWDNTVANYVWTNGPYTDWEYQEVTGEHWVYQYFDQIDKQWKDGWVPLTSDSNLIGGLTNNTNIFQVNEAYVTSVGGLLQLVVNVTITPNTPHRYFRYFRK